MRLGIYMITCAARVAVMEQTIENWKKTDFYLQNKTLPIVVPDTDAVEGLGLVCDRAQSRQEMVSRRVLEMALAAGWDYFLFLEDDLEFNVNLLHNLSNWEPLAEDWITLASLYNPNIGQFPDKDSNWFIADPNKVYGSQAFLISRECAEYILTGWNRVPGMQDIKFSRLASFMRNPIYYHTPSLVQHVGKKSAWTTDNRFHCAFDYDAEWKASETPEASAEGSQANQGDQA